YSGHSLAIIPSQGRGIVTSVAISPSTANVLIGCADSSLYLVNWRSFSQRHPATSRPLTRGEVLLCWDGLAHSNPDVAYRAMDRLRTDPSLTLSILTPWLRPFDPSELKPQCDLLCDLDSDTFSLRRHAYQQLLNPPADAIPLLLAAFRTSNSLECRDQIA